MRLILCASLTLLAAVSAGCTSTSAGAGPGGALDAGAEATLRAMSECLGSAERFEFAAATTVDPHPDAWPPVHERGEVRFAVERPGRLHARVRGDHARRDVFLLDGVLTIHDLDRNVAECHHLAFEGTWAHAEAWFETGPNPLARRLVLTYVHEPGRPKYEASFTDWRLDATPDDRTFRLATPRSFEEIEVISSATAADEAR